MLKLGVVFGGETVEHEVSIISALQAMSNIDTSKYEVVPIYISKDRIWYSGEALKDINFYRNFNKKSVKQVVLYKKNNDFYLRSVDNLINHDITNIDIVLPIVHGNNVEDGSLIGYFDTLGICYVASSILGSSIAQDKVVMKELMSSHNIPVVPYTWFYDYEYIHDKNKILKNIKIIEIYLLNYKNIVYNGTNKYDTCVSMLTATSFKELEEIVGDLEEGRRIMEKLKELGLDDKYGAYYDAEIVRKKEINSARSEGYTDGKKEGIISIAKTMLKAGESVNKVMSYTGLKKKDIMSLM